ncbi:hypothetical protein N2152v2_005125 [Parachlorella kessleri]
MAELPTESLTSLELVRAFEPGGLSHCFGLSRLTKLQRLTLRDFASSRDYSAHTRMPEAVTSLTALTHLDFSDNGLLSRLPPLDTLPMLLHVDLSRTLLPPSAAQAFRLGAGASALTYLALTGFVAGKVDLVEHPHLCSLSLSECHLFEAPPGLAELSQLTSLDLSRGLNGRLAIPLHASYPRQLFALDVSSAGLRQPPVGLAALSALTKLDLSGNRLTAGMERLAAVAPSLQHLCLRSCGLPALPPELSSLAQLTLLDLSANPGLLARGEAGQLAALSGLQVLSLSDTGVRGLGPSFSTLRSLSQLHLGGMAGGLGLGGLGVLPALVSLDLSHCGACGLPPRLTGLTYLSLNGVSHGEWELNIAGLGRLQELDISGCCTAALPHGIGALTALRRLRVGPGKGLKAQKFGADQDRQWLENMFGTGGPFDQDVTLYRVWV